jgi:F0F1-type ATP synthase gamma subunit
LILSLKQIFSNIQKTNFRLTDEIIAYALAKAGELKFVNQARQAAITREISEIVGGAAALEGESPYGYAFGEFPFL